MSAAAAAAATAPLVIGRYALFDELAAGGMATVHLGRLLGPAGFGRTVAVKRLHAHYLKDEEFITMFMDEARIVARIRHPNVVPMVDVVQSDKGLFLVMEYVHGESLSRLVRTARKQNEAIPPRIVAAIMSGVLLGLHAAHETRGADGELLNVVHRDVSPQNVIIGSDGIARVLDFGIAKAAGRAQVTREGQIKGKLAYMAPEQIRGQVDRRTDVFAAAVVLWEMLAGKRLHGTAKDVDIVTRIMQGSLPRPSQHEPAITPDIDDIVMRALASDPKKRVATARDLALELEKTVGLASPSEVSEWVEHLAHDVLEARSNLVNAMELAAGDLLPVETNPPPAPFGATPMDPIPNTGHIPVDFDPAHNTSSHEVPSSSAVFASGSERSADSGDVQPRRKIDRTTWTVIAISSLLALIGVILGAYAIAHRAAAPEPAITPSALPRTAASPPSAASTSTGAGATSAQLPAAPSADDKAAPASGATSAAMAATGASPATTPTWAGAAAATASATAAASGTSGSTSTASTTGASKPAGVLPAPATTLKKPAGKPACEPPYTVDDVGHRHYKPECMGLE